MGINMHQTPTYPHFNTTLQIFAEDSRDIKNYHNITKKGSYIRFESNLRIKYKGKYYLNPCMQTYMKSDDNQSDN